MISTDLPCPPLVASHHLGRQLQPNYYVVRADGQQLAYIYYSNDPERRAAAKLLTKDEARRIACDDGGSTKDKWAEHRSGPLGGIKIAIL
jgi:hypothetical protein